MSAVDDAWAQQGGPPPPTAPAAPSAIAPGTSMFASWAASGPWMAAAAPRTADSIQPASGWKLKVIRSLDKKLKEYAPTYATEDEEETEEPVETMIVRKGIIKKNKNGCKPIRPVK